mmetsp:Transcript_10631/g.24210  ORF Transcript_10631/g.24210 Transcript_10631/m.24210 type:complete len:213 (-) Transcript_10631:1601-2239(-)
MAQALLHAPHSRQSAMRPRFRQSQLLQTHRHRWPCGRVLTPRWLRRTVGNVLSGKPTLGVHLCRPQGQLTRQLRCCRPSQAHLTPPTSQRGWLCPGRGRQSRQLREDGAFRRCRALSKRRRQLLMRHQSSALQVRPQQRFPWGALALPTRSPWCNFQRNRHLEECHLRPVLVLLAIEAEAQAFHGCCSRRPCNHRAGSSRGEVRRRRAHPLR